MRNKKLLILISMCTIIILLIVIIFITINESTKHNKNITRAEAAKMIALACDTEENISSASNSKAVSDNWYDRYVLYVNNNGYMNIDKPMGNVTYGDIKVFLQRLGKLDILMDADLSVHKDSETIDRDHFINIYIEVLRLMDTQGSVQIISAGIVGTPSNIAGADEWQAYTTKGIYNFEGLILDNAIDKMVGLIVKGNKVLCVQSIESTDVTYKNVWVVEGNGDRIEAYVYGVMREFKIKNLSQNISQVLADIHLSDKSVVRVDIKNDTINGKVLAVTEQFVEIEGYGRVVFDEDYKIYENYDGLLVKDYTDIVVGYSLQNFIVADGKICGAIISQSLLADNIRVLIKTTDFESLFHDSVTVTCAENYTMYYGEKVERHQPGENITISSDSEYMQEERVKIQADNGGSIAINSISRSQGIPAYEGIIEISATDKGMIIVNDISIEKYLKRVVPSEMPVKFGVEALKVQAVCARSYVYKQLTNNAYSAYGAHVDDSTLYQVYNNVNENENSNKAIEETKGEVLTYNGEVVQTYYYSTSCGYTTDVSIWGSNPEEYPYFVSRSVSAEKKTLDLTDEDTFAAFIKNVDPNDYDSGFPLYRWRLNVTIEQLSKSLNSKLDKSIGNITAIKVTGRTCGGAINSVQVTGTKNTTTIEGEGNVRRLFGVSEVPLITATGETRTMSSLPSAFCIFEATYTKGVISGYSIIGGGYGHGIGMSQNAVSAMVEKNMSYEDILNFFYEGTKVEKFSNIK